MKILGFEFSKIKHKQTQSKNFSANHHQFLPAHMYQNTINTLLKNIDFDAASLALLKVARNLSISNPTLYGYLQTMDSEIFGDRGFILDLNSPDETFNLKIEGLWKEFEQECYLNNDYDFRDIERFVLLHYLRDGECFIHIANIKDVGIKLQIIPPEFIDYNLNDGEKIKKGIEFDRFNKASAYYVLKNNTNKSEHIKIPSQNMIHLKRVFNSTQIRGIPHIAPVLSKLIQSDKYIESVIAQAHIASGFSLIAKSKEGEGFEGNIGDLEESKSIEPKTIEMQEGRIIAMNENYDIQPLNINHNPNIEAFMSETNFKIAKGLGISYMTLTGDTSKANFSSMRSGLLPERRLNKRIQKTIIRKVHNKIYEAFIEDLALRGVLKPKEYQLASKQYTFRTQGFDWIDPTKEIPMLKMQLQMGTKTLIQALNDVGIEPPQHLKDLKESNDLFLEELMRLSQVYSPHAIPIYSDKSDDQQEKEENQEKEKEDE